MLPLEYWIIVGVTAISVIVCVSIHYEGLRFLSRMPIGSFNDRHRIIIMILCIMMLHIVEVWVFGLAYYFLLLNGDFGSLQGMSELHLFDSVYFSATVFSTLGFGDIIPIGPIRFVTGTQSIAGLTLITWSASFTFVEMMRPKGESND